VTEQFKIKIKREEESTYPGCVGRKIFSGLSVKFQKDSEIGK